MGRQRDGAPVTLESLAEEDRIRAAGQANAKAVRRSRRS